MLDELLAEFANMQIDMVLNEAIKHAEKLPGGKYFAPPRTPEGAGMLIDKESRMLILLTRKDVSRMYGLCYPSVVHGKWTGDCGGREPRQETAFEKAIKDQAEANQEEDVKDAQALMGDI